MIRFRWTLLFLVIVSAASYLRFYNIGEHGFWTDELFHVFAARSYLDHGTFQVPWLHNEYTRGLPVTLLTAFSFKLFGEGEAAARGFFALSNVLLLVIATLVLKSLFSRRVALLFAMATAFSVISIQMSQECRMYTLFQLFYFLTSVTFLIGIEPPASGRLRQLPGLLGRLDHRMGTSLVLLGASVVLAAVSFVLHPLVVNFMLVVVAYCLIMLGYESRQAGVRHALRTRYAGALIVIAVAAAVAWVAARGTVIEVIRFASESPSWNMPTSGRLGFYYRTIIDSHPFSWALYPLGAFLMIQRYGRRGLFFVLSFAVLFPLHCFVFGRKSERYIFYILPFMITAAAAAAEFLIAGVERFGSEFASSVSRSRRRWFLATSAALCVLIGVPRVQQVAADTAVAKFPDWKNLDRGLVQTVSHATAITTDRWGFSYYFAGNPIILDSGQLEADENVIRTLDDYRRISARHPVHYLVTYASNLNSPAFVSPELRDYILREMDRVDDQKNDKRIMVFAARR